MKFRTIERICSVKQDPWLRHERRAKSVDGVRVLFSGAVEDYCSRLI